MTNKAYNKIAEGLEDAIAQADKPEVGDEKHYEFIVEQNGGIVAIVGGSDKDAAFQEAMHYAMIYGQDGPCKIREADPIDAGDWEDD
jgi:hypothetical protein